MLTIFLITNIIIRTQKGVIMKLQNMTYREKEKEPLYIAQGAAVTRMLENGFVEKSDPLGLILVTPVYNKDSVDDEVFGYREVITNKMVIKKLTYHNDKGTLLLKNEDINSQNSQHKSETYIGELIWDVITIVDARDYLPLKAIEKYFKQSPNEVEIKLNLMRKIAKGYDIAGYYTKKLRQ